MRPVVILKRIRSFGNVTYGDGPTGVFHGWSVDLDEFDNGVGTYAVAIVELPDGTVQLPRADMVRFTDVAKADECLILRGHRALDAVKHCQDKMTALMAQNDHTMRNTAPVDWTPEQVRLAEATAKHINQP